MYWRKMLNVYIRYYLLCSNEMFIEYKYKACYNETMKAGR